MRMLRILLIGLMVLASASVAQAVPLTSFGQPVEGILSSSAAIPDCPGSGGQPCFDTGTGQFSFYIPLTSVNSGIFGVPLTIGPNSGKEAGTFADTGSGTAQALKMFLRFSPVANPAASASLAFNFEDLDLIGVNDPPYFFESVIFYDASGIAMSPLITTSGQSSSGSPFAFTVSGDSTFQTITFPNITSIVQDPFFVELRFNSQYNSTGTNTPESLTAILTSTPVPEPGTLLLLGSGLIGAGIFSRRYSNQS